MKQPYIYVISLPKISAHFRLINHPIFIKYYNTHMQLCWLITTFIKEWAQNVSHIGNRLFKISLASSFSHTVWCNHSTDQITWPRKILTFKFTHPLNTSKSMCITSSTSLDHEHKTQNTHIMNINLFKIKLTAI